MEKIPFFCLAAFSLLLTAQPVHADDPKRSDYHGDPTMAYYAKGRVIYYDFTEYKKPVLKYSSILASNSAYARAHYQEPTMAFYKKDKTIHYAYTQYPPSQAVRGWDWRNFGHPYRQFPRAWLETGSPARSLREEPKQTAPSIKMRASTLSSREAFEQESEQAKGTPEENRSVLLSSPTDAAGFYKRGNAYKDTYDYGKAIQDYDEVIRMDPENAYAYYKRGLCYSALDRMDLANENFLRANDIMADQERFWSQKSRSWYPQSGY